MIFWNGEKIAISSQHSVFSPLASWLKGESLVGMVRWWAEAYS